MKKIFNLFFVLAIMTSVFSCGDDDNDISSDNPLAGTWEMMSLDYTTSATTSGGGQSITSNSVGTGENIAYTLEFTDDMYSADGGYDIRLVTDLQGQEIEQTVSITDVETSGGYTFDETSIMVQSGSLVTFSADGQSSSGMSSTEPTNYTIDSNGDLIFSDVTTTSTSQQGFTSTSTVDFTMRFVKQ